MWLIDGSLYAEYHRMDSLNVLMHILTQRWGGILDSNVWWKQKKTKSYCKHIIQDQLIHTCPSVVIRAFIEFPRLPGRSWPLHAVCAGVSAAPAALCYSAALCCHWSSIPTPRQQPPVGSVSSIPIGGGRGGCLLFIPCNVWADYHQGMNALNLVWHRTWCQTCFSVNALLTLKIILVIYIQLLLLQRIESVNVSWSWMNAKVNIRQKTEMNI